MIDITNPSWRCWYFAIAGVVSLIYGIFAFWIHETPHRPKKDKWWLWLHQFWLNFLGAEVGWIAGWVVINRWLSCPSFMCVDEPKFATIVLALAAFVGMAGYLPMAVMSSVAALRSALETYFRKVTGR